jgi:hypothetical protein
MLPRLKSYLLADNSLLWGHLSTAISNLPLRHEHQLFPGLAVTILILIGIIFHFHTEISRIAWLHFSATLVLIVLTMNVKGISFYSLVWHLPGMNSIRAVTRIMLVIMWPLSLFISWSVNGIIQQLRQQQRWKSGAIYLVAGLLVVESVFYSHTTYDKTDAQARLDSLRRQIPTTIPADPILFVARDQEEPFWAKEIDAMLLAQQLGWPTLNGYSGNYPPGYAPADSCKQLQNWIMNYMNFARISDLSFYKWMMQRVIPIGFQDCDPTWWEKMP